MLFMAVAAKANNVQLSNISVSNNAANTGKIIEFDLSWENSWRTASTNNWDGVWVFFKFKDNDGRWYPLRFTGTNNNMPTGFTHDMGNNVGVTGVGMFIYRSANGAGTATAIDVRAGIQSMPGTFEVRGFAIEMVYIPQGSFWIGDGSIGNRAYQSGRTGNNPFQVTGNGNTIIHGTGTGMLYDTINPALTGNLLTGFPTGYSAFWIMKYELSGGAYRDFLNTLSYAQQRNRIYYTPNSATGTWLMDSAWVNFRRVNLEIATPGIAPVSGGLGTPAVIGCDFDNDNIYNETTDGEWITYNLTNWGDCAAYLDWAGLRPMTEMEYEKACRGPLSPVVEEYAWGNADRATQQYTLTNAGMNNESVSNPSSAFGNFMDVFTTNGIATAPARGGIFATAISTRISSGAGYYGALELSGNVEELTITTANVAGRSFTGKHGDGLLTSVGNANENYWPGVNGTTGTSVSPGLYDGGQGVRSAGGIIERGGSFEMNYTVAQISNRFFTPNSGVSEYENWSHPSVYMGIRGVRDAN